MKFEFDNNIPIYIQLVEELKSGIARGVYKPGEKIPSVRDLAMSAKVNPNTMQKALIELEEMGLLYTERTNGKYVTEDKSVIKRIKDDYADAIVKKYFLSMESLGYSREEAISYLKERGNR